MILRDEIIQKALTLSPADRAYVADTLEQSLADGAFATPEIAAAWNAELERRLAAYDRGDTKAEGVGAAFEYIEQRLADHRARKATP
ncbi:MAG: addiction module protein [Thermoguttaceae bacterium]|jgi:putative addiction module component (TIGR02574 family)